MKNNIVRMDEYLRDKLLNLDFAEYERRVALDDTEGADRVLDAINKRLDRYGEMIEKMSVD